MADAEIGFDFSSLNTLAADFGKVAADVMPNVLKAIQVTSVHTKNDARDAAKKANRKHAKAYPYSIDFDIEKKPGQISSQVGPNLSKNQGSLGILEEAQGGVRSAPQSNLRTAAKKNIPDFEKGMRLAAGSVTKKP
jgi:hypothetical protein